VISPSDPSSAWTAKANKRVGDDNAAIGFDIAFRNRVSDAACNAGDQATLPLSFMMLTT
jgi:hypothetical protein